jgi:hypothetical protein
LVGESDTSGWLYSDRVNVHHFPANGTTPTDEIAFADPFGQLVSAVNPYNYRIRLFGHGCQVTVSKCDGREADKRQTQLPVVVREPLTLIGFVFVVVGFPLFGVVVADDHGVLDLVHRVAFHAYLAALGSNHIR